MHEPARRTSDQSVSMRTPHTLQVASRAEESAGCPWIQVYWCQVPQIMQQMTGVKVKLDA